jgi:hypothetical protein
MTKNYFDECEKNGIDVGSCTISSMTCYNDGPTKHKCNRCRCSKCERAKCPPAMDNRGHDDKGI